MTVQLPTQLIQQAVIGSQTVDPQISLSKAADSNNLTISGYGSDEATQLANFEYAIYDGSSACDVANAERT